MIPDTINNWLENRGVTTLRPSQQKSVESGLFERKNLLVCTPTASGKTLVGEMGMRHSQGKSLYIVPLRALASEKYSDFKKHHSDKKVMIATGDADEKGGRYEDADILIATSEKFDSLLRHKPRWIESVGCVVVDEIHLLTDPHRGPTLEVVLTLLKKVRPEAQIIGLSATIGNPGELAEWLGAELIEDSWRPVTLYKGTYSEGRIEFYDTEKSTKTGK